MNNPFSLTFGKEPSSIIARDFQVSEIQESFTAEPPSVQAYMITGVRGSGKTVLLTSVSRVFAANRDWIVVPLSPDRDLLHALAAELSNRPELLQIFKDAKINLSILGFGVEIDNQPPITDIIVALDRMLDRLTKKGKKILVTVDEVVSSRFIREFVSQFQIFVRKNYNVFLLMTGLYDNLYELQNEETLTFLYRAPKITMSPLNKKNVAAVYMATLGISEATALEMAEVTKGYPYAYQVLGYLCCKNGTSYTEELNELDRYLEEYVYEKIWSELSVTDQKVLLAMAESDSAKVEDIRAAAGMNSNNFTVYRKRLIRKGLVSSPQYGKLELSLPRFEEFARQYA